MVKLHATDDPYLHAALPDNARKTYRLAALARLRGHAADLIHQARR